MKYPIVEDFCSGITVTILLKYFQHLDRTPTYPQGQTETSHNEMCQNQKLINSDKCKKPHFKEYSTHSILT